MTFQGPGDFHLTPQQTHLRNTLFPKPNDHVHVEPGMFFEERVNPAALTWVNVSEPSGKKKFKTQIRGQARAYAHAQKRKANIDQQAKVSFLAAPLIHQRSNWNHNPFVKLPVEATNEFKEFMHFLSLDNRPLVAYYRSVYFNHTTRASSEGAFYSSLSLIPTVLCTQRNTPAPLKPYYERQDLRYSSKAMKYIQTQLVDDEQVKTSSEGLVSAVQEGLTIHNSVTRYFPATHSGFNILDARIVFSNLVSRATLPNFIDGQDSRFASLLMKSQLRLDWATAAQHFNALEKIINIRGGLHGLENYTKLLIVFIDAIKSCSQDHTLRLTRPDDHLGIATSMKDLYTTLTQDQLPDGARVVSCKLRDQYPENERIIALFEKAAVYHIERLNGRNTEYAHSDNTIRNILLHLLIALLSAQVVVDYENEASIMYEILRLALLVFVISKGKRVPDVKYIEYTVQMRKLREMFELYEPSWKGLLELRAWVVAIALVNAEGEDDVDWWTLEWRTVLRAMARNEPKPVSLAYCVFDVARSRREGGEVEVVSRRVMPVPYQVSDIMWLESIHGKRYQELFQAL